jgi:outer membrane autotransporter protein
MPTAVAGADPIPTYRQEVPVYSVVVPAAQLMLMHFLGTFHERQGEQSLLTETGYVPAGWGRVYGSSIRKSWTGDASPRLDGSDKGFQIGHDIIGTQTSGGQLQRAGLFVGKSRLHGDVDGFAEGFQDTRVGKTKLDGEHVGAYWTLSDPLGWYVDLVAMYSWLSGDSHSERGVKLDTDGYGTTLSAEVGYPIEAFDNWVIEPQAQVVNQRIHLDDQNDGISDVSFDSQDYWTGRLGARLKGRYLVDDKPLEPFVRANVWRTFGGYDTVTYNDFDQIKTEHKSSSADLGLGLVAQLSASVSAYVSIDYTTNLDSNNQEGFTSGAGLRISW